MNSALTKAQKRNLRRKRNKSRCVYCLNQFPLCSIWLERDTLCQRENLLEDHTPFWEAVKNPFHFGGKWEHVKMRYCKRTKKNHQIVFGYIRNPRDVDIFYCKLDGEIRGYTFL